MPYFRTELLRNNLDTVWRLRASPTALCNNSVPVCTAEHTIILVISSVFGKKKTPFIVVLSKLVRLVEGSLG